MELRIVAATAEIKQALKALEAGFQVRSVSDFYRMRGSTQLRRVYADAVPRIAPHGHNGLDAIRANVTDVSNSLLQWDSRQEGKSNPAARRAASNAVDAIDALRQELFRLRERLIHEIRVSDDATATRIDTLFAERGEQR